MVNRIAILLRGHIRDSFKSTKLIDFINTFIAYYGHSRCDIFIHTWNLSEAKRSWRSLNVNNIIKIDENIIKKYFSNISNNIKKIIIEDDTKIRLIGSINGFIFRTPCPKVCWKNMWYGNYKICEYVHNLPLPEYKICINMRMDLFDIKFTFAANISTPIIIDRVNNQLTKIYPKLEFFRKPENYGIDNIYISTVLDSYKLAREFYFNMDRFHETYMRVRHQEFIVPYIASELGLTSIKIFPTIRNKKKLIVPTSKWIAPPKYKSTPSIVQVLTHKNIVSKPIPKVTRKSNNKVKMKLINQLA